jgi:hypothetical protein
MMEGMHAMPSMNRHPMDSGRYENPTATIAEINCPPVMNRLLVVTRDPRIREGASSAMYL